MSRAVSTKGGSEPESEDEDRMHAAQSETSGSVADAAGIQKAELELRDKIRELLAEIVGEVDPGATIQKKRTTRCAA